MVCCGQSKLMACLYQVYRGWCLCKLDALMLCVNPMSLNSKDKWALGSPVSVMMVGVGVGSE